MSAGALRLDRGWHNRGYIFPEGYTSQTVFRSSVRTPLGIQVCLLHTPEASCGQGLPPTSSSDSGKHASLEGWIWSSCLGQYYSCLHCSSIAECGGACAWSIWGAWVPSNSWYSSQRCTLSAHRGVLHTLCAQVELDQLCLHTCTILGGGGCFWPAPTFRITAADRPQEMIDAKTPTGAWNAVLSRINAEIETRRAHPPACLWFITCCCLQFCTVVCSAW